MICPKILKNSFLLHQNARKSLIFVKFRKILRSQGTKRAKRVKIKKNKKITKICIETIILTSFHIYMTFFGEIMNLYISNSKLKIS